MLDALHSHVLIPIELPYAYVLPLDQPVKHERRFVRSMSKQNKSDQQVILILDAFYDLCTYYLNILRRNEYINGWIFLIES